MSDVKNIPQGWVETTLGEVVEIGSSKRIFFSEYVTEGIPFYRSKEIIEKQKGNNISSELFITEKKFDEIEKQFGSPKKDDLLLTSVGTLGVPYIVKENEKFYFKDGNLTWFKNYKNLTPKYLYDWLLSPIGKERINEITIGSTQSALTISGLRTLKINLPSLPEQKSIAAILTAFDDKIELLQAQNKTLEALAQTIFAAWFGKYQIGDELPDGWEYKTLGEVSTLSAGGDKPKRFSDERTDIFNTPIYSNGINNNGLYGYTDKPKIKEESVTISARGTIGFVCLRFEPFVPIVRLVVAIPNQKFISSKYLYLFLKNMNILSTGTTQQQLTVPAFKNENILIPKAEIMQKFTSICDSLFSKIIINDAQIQTLTNTRDTLLPKLMSAAVRVKF